MINDYISVNIYDYFFIFSVEEKSEPAQPTVTTTSKMFTLFGKKNKNNQEQAKNNKVEKEEDPYAGFGVEEVAAPLQTDDLEYDEGFQVNDFHNGMKTSILTFTIKKRFI